VCLGSHALRTNNTQNIFPVFIMICISPMEHQSNKCYSIGTNRIIGTNGRIERTPTQPETIGNILRLYNETHFTNRTPIE